MLIDKALTWGYVLSPLAAPHHRREGLVFGGPSNKGKHSRPSTGGGRGNLTLTYTRSSGACPGEGECDFRALQRRRRRAWRARAVGEAGLSGVQQ